jgi:hypothetical protein
MQAVVLPVLPANTPDAALVTDTLCCLLLQVKCRIVAKACRELLRGSFANINDDAVGGWLVQEQSKE